MKDVVKDVGSFQADPGQTVHLKSARFDVSVKGAPVMALDCGMNPYVFKLVLNDGGQSKSKRVARCFIDDSSRIPHIEPGLSDKSTRQLRIVLVLGK